MNRDLAMLRDWGTYLVGEDKLLSALLNDLGLPVVVHILINAVRVVEKQDPVCCVQLPDLLKKHLLVMFTLCLRLQFLHGHRAIDPLQRFEGII